MTKLTHFHPLGLEGAQIQAAAVAASLLDLDVLAAAQQAANSPAFQEKLTLVAEALSERWSPTEVAFRLGNNFLALDSVPAALWAALSGESVEEALTLAVRVGGDTDTIAAMAGAVSGSRYGASAIPERFLAGLENGARGRDYLQALAERLWNK